MKRYIKTNLNNNIKIKLTQEGINILDNLTKVLKEKFPNVDFTNMSKLIQIDEEGYARFQLWEFINLYGQYISMTAPLICDTEIFIEYEAEE